MKCSQREECQITDLQVKQIKSVTFQSGASQGQTQTTCPCEKLKLMFYAWVAPVKTRWYFQVEFTYLVRLRPPPPPLTSPLSVCGATLNMLKSSQYVLPDRTDSCLTVTLPTVNPSNCRKGWIILKRCPRRQKVNFLFPAARVLSLRERKCWL